MNHLLLLLSALTGLGVVSLTSALEYQVSMDFYFSGTNYKNVYVKHLMDKVTVCFEAFYNKDANLNCIIVKGVKQTKALFQTTMFSLVKSYQKTYFPSFSDVTSLTYILFHYTGEKKVVLYFLTSKDKSGIVFRNLKSNSKSEYEILAGEASKIDEGSFTDKTAVDVNQCKTKSGTVVSLGKKHDKGNCEKQICRLISGTTSKVPGLVDIPCDKNIVCVKGVCQYKAVCTFTGPSIIDIDRQTNTIKDRCSYLLFSSSTLGDFTIHGGYMSRRRRDTSFLDNVVITHNSNEYVLEQGGRFKNKGTEESLSGSPKDIDGLQVSKTERGLLVSYTDKGFTISIFFDGYTAQIMTTGSPKTPFPMEGMCAKASTPLKTVKNSCDKTHKEDPDSLINCPKVKDSCAVLKKAPFTGCNAVISPDPYVKVCEETLCAYPSVDNLPCQFLEAYARACEVWTQNKVDGWRSNSKCSATPKALCQGTFCSSMEFCGQKRHTGSWTCLCKAVAVKSYRDSNTLGDPTFCNKNTASVSLVNCLLMEKGIDFTKLHLNDPSCKGVLSDGMVTFEFSSSKKCGTIITDSDKEVVYQNSIKSAESSGEIVRQGEVNMDFSCSHAQPKVNSLQFSVSSSSVTDTITSGSWVYGLTMKAFLDPSLSKPATKVQINQKVWVELKTTGLDAALVAMVIDSCWATKSKEPEKAPKYYLISGSCANPKDKTVQINGNGKGTSSSFSFNTFQFPKSKSDVFLHCKVKLCGLKAGKTCVPTCGNSGRKRRSASFMDEDPAPALITITWTS